MTTGTNCLSILLVDDDPFVLSVTAKALSNLGHEKIETASNGNAALGKLITCEKPFDIIICDLNMPEMDGAEFMRHAGDTDFNGGVILLSGEDKRMLETTMGLAKLHKLNVLGALNKPLVPEVLDQLVNKFEPASREMGQYLPPKSISEADLRNGIKGSSENQLMLVYQPMIHVGSGQIVAVETLARWWNEKRGVLGPGTFIPLAESSKLIDPLTNLIYKKAMMQASEWEEQGRKLKMAINFSVNSFSDPAFCSFLVETAANYGVNTQQIVLEITETQAMTIEVDCLEALIGMRLKGYSLSIDDFGTGNSSLTQLKNIPFTELKIDRSFVTGASKDLGSQAILESSVKLAKKLNMEIVAEGIETNEDWELVQELGVDYVQGFYWAKPMRNEELLEFLDSWKGPNGD